MESSQRPTTPEAPLAQSNMESVPTNINTTTPANEHLTTLSEGAYAGPTKEDLALLCTHAASKAQEKKVSIDDVVKGFRDLGKAMSASDLLTTLLHALAKDETETLFEWLLWERFKDNPPADGMGHW